MDTNLFEYTDYKEFLKDLLHAESSRGLQSQLARHLGCQASYLYQTLKGKAELTEDQSFKATSFFNFSKSARDYFLCLVRYSKAASPELKEFLKQDLERLRAEELNLKNKADSSVAEDSDKIWDYYFSGQIPSMIHILTSSPNFQSAAAIAEKIKMPESSVLACLKKLSECGFVTQKNKRWQFSSPSLHLPKESKHNFTIQLMRRTQVINALLRAKADSTHYSSLFTLDKKSYQSLKQEVSKFVEKSQRLIHAGGTDEVYILCLDLFDPLGGDL